MNDVINMVFGSHVYGTNTPTSDRDFKSVIIPDAESILLQKAQTSKHFNTKQDDSAKNNPEDTDIEQFSLHYFFKLLLEGQTITIDMLFIPEEFWINKSRLWEEIVYYRKEFVSAKTEAFIGYCRTQANKYGIKGSRMAAAKAAVDVLCNLPANSRLEEFSAVLAELALRHEFIELEDIENKSSGKTVTHLSVCGRKVPFTSRIDRAYDVYKLLFDKYGERARQAMDNENIDWKAMMHATRIIQQAQELRNTGFITFPRPNADELIKIRTGQKSFKEVSEVIEQGVETLDNTPCVLRLEPNKELARKIILDCYTNEIVSYQRMGQCR